MKKSLVLILIIVTAAIFTLGLAIYLKNKVGENLREPQISEERSALPPQRAETKTYVNNEHGFSLQYPTSIPPFEETLTVEELDHLYVCRYYDDAHGLYETLYQFSKKIDLPQIYTNLGCTKSASSFDEYVAHYMRIFIAHPNPEKKRLKTTSQNSAYLLHWQIPGTNINTSEKYNYQSYRILIEIPDYQNQYFRAILINHDHGSGFQSCSDSICQIGETPETCPTDCRESWTKILSEIIESFQFKL